MVRPRADGLNQHSTKYMSNLKFRFSTLRLSLPLILAASLAACGGGDDSGGSGGGSTPPVTYTVGGNVTGLSGTVVLQNNGGGNLSVSTSGAFTFATAVNSGSTYAVTVLTQPTGQTCTVTNGSGTASANVSNVAVACAASQYSLGGTVTGLSGTLVLKEDQRGDSVAVTANGSYRFNVNAAHGGTYAASVFRQPAGQTCTVAGGSGTATAPVTSINVTCASNTFTVSGTITGATSAKVMQLNLGDTATVLAGATTFAFPNALASGTPYFVSIAPSNQAVQTCLVTNGIGTATSNITNVQVNCSAADSTFFVGGSVQGLTSGSVELQNNAGETIVRSATGAYQFPTKLTLGTEYVVSVKTQPAGQTCVVTNAAGTAGALSATNSVVNCSSGVPAETHTVGGTVTGLKAPLRLVMDKANAIQTVTPAGGAAVTFTFPVALAIDTDFKVLPVEQPTGQTCLIPHSGTRVAHANITDINVTCFDNVTDSLSGTFTQFGGEMAVTFYPGGVYLFASVADDTACGTNNGNGVELGAYRYNATAGTITFISNVLDTNGANCGVWRNGASVLNGSLTKTGSGQNQVLVLSGASINPPVVLVPVTSNPNELIGSFTTGDWSFLVFSPGGVYLEAHANHDPASNAPAGVEFGCYSGNASGINGSISVVSCNGSLDTDGTAGLSSLGGAALSYSALGPYAMNFGNGRFLGFRVVPAN